ncbi:hypothetical protein DFH08DRAFT_1082932 [Mycena albidolilacea]|uniref:Uncharacterized protein n=1 Tax=Mycena albidolilacea TaxID=1033008 RepID=A0AAD6ZTP0_9AGAR|nr:hypothetical protein DFH08DRAFT_1082932 [Mycena albidolilacea]
MATLKRYYGYIMAMGGCGIPRVTLEGERADWVDILGRLEKLKEYGLEATAWYHLLRPVIPRLIAGFDNPTSPYNSAAPAADPRTLTPTELWATYEGPNTHTDLVIDGTPYHRVHSGGIPPGYCEVDIVLVDNRVRFDGAMDAGIVGTRLSSSGWWLFVKDEENMDEKAQKVYQREHYKTTAVVIESSF